MAPTTPPLDFDYNPGDEIPTKYKGAIRQLYSFAKIPIDALIDRYKLSKSTIYYILAYAKPEYTPPIRTRRPQKLSDYKVD
jgi:hypothetical protein